MDPERAKCLEVYLKLKEAIEQAQEVSKRWYGLKVLVGKGKLARGAGQEGISDKRDARGS